MNKEKAKQLFRYIGGKEQIEFLVNHIVPELKEKLSIDNFYGKFFLFEDFRRIHLQKLVDFVRTEILENETYLDEIEKVFYVKSDIFCYEILVFYFFCETLVNPQLSNVNIFLDKQSVFYTGFDFFA